MKKDIRKRERREIIDPLHFEISLHSPTHEMHVCHVLVAPLLTSQSESYHNFGGGREGWGYGEYISSVGVAGR